MGGYHLETLSLGPAFMASFAHPGTWGPELTARLDAYPGTAGMWITGEVMPQETNRVTLSSTLNDQHGLPVPNLYVSDGSVMTTSGAANPTLRIVALATGQAEFIAEQLRKGHS